MALLQRHSLRLYDPVRRNQCAASELMVISVIFSALQILDARAKARVPRLILWLGRTRRSFGKGGDDWKGRDALVSGDGTRAPFNLTGENLK